MPPPRTLLAWIGNRDFEGAGVRPRTTKHTGPGPIAAALEALPFDEALLLCDYTRDEAERYRERLIEKTRASIEVRVVKLPSPSDYAAIYRAAREAIESVRARGPRALTFHLAPGTPAMTVVWILLGKLRYPATLIQGSPEQGLEEAKIPFDLAGDFVPDLLRARDAELAARVEDPAGAGFGAILHRDATMVAAISRARRAALHPYPVLLQGETGTGKELFARAIAHASPRAKKNIVTVNCGAIPPERVEADFFGWTKGAFTDASGDHPGYFVQAHGGTLFLDEIGELPLAMQAKLLRALQDGEVRPLGAKAVTKVDVRIVAATHRDLLAEVTAGRFREDLFYRLAVLAVRVPPLRERGEDVLELANFFLERLTAPDGRRKKLSRDARELVLRHRWPGNVRELRNAMERAMILEDSSYITPASLPLTISSSSRAAR